jgi:hypothetical protein
MLRQWIILMSVVRAGATAQVNRVAVWGNTFYSFLIACDSAGFGEQEINIQVTGLKTTGTFICWSSDHASCFPMN